jgi:RHS repeat-associated protein
MRVGAPADPGCAQCASVVRLSGRNGLATSSLIRDGDGNSTLKTLNGVTTTYGYDAFGNGVWQATGSATPYGTAPTVQWLDYAPYGTVIASQNTGTTTAARQFIGQFADVSGLSYLNARYYNGTQGQFTSEDPVFLGTPSQQNLQDPQSLNSYSYSEDNPILRSDPNGRNAFTLGAQATFWNGTVSAGLNIDQYGIDYYYGFGAAAGAEVGINAGMTTDNLAHQYSVTSSIFGETGDVWGGGASWNNTSYPYSKKAEDNSVSMYGGFGVGDAAGVRGVVSGPIITWGSNPANQSSEFYTGPTTISAYTPPTSSWSLPATVTTGGTTYFRNSSGLLSSTVSISTPTVFQGVSNNHNPTGASSGCAPWKGGAFQWV